MEGKLLFKMARPKKTIENMFVPQTFNGERMVSVGALDRGKISNSASPTPTFDINNNVTNNNPMPKRTNKVPSTSNIPPPPAAAAAAEKNKGKNPDLILQNGNVQPFQLTLYSSGEQLATQQQITPPPLEQLKYWSEANIVILIQLHKRYISDNNNQQDLNLDQWKHLTTEFNKITGNNRTVNSITKRWTKILRKYNAERQWVILEQQRNKSNQIISCWTHYQFLNSYLGHLPISSFAFKRSLDSDDSDDDDDNNYKRPKRHGDTLHSLFEIQRVMVEQAMTRQQSQIDLMKENYESMNNMNLKFVKVCERITTKSETNEKRYLDLLEKYLKLQHDVKNSTTSNNASLDNDNDEFMSPATAETWLGVED